MAIKLLIENGRFRSLERIEQKIDGIIDNGDHFLVNSIGDLHGHVMHLGNLILGLNLESCKSIDECIEKTKDHDKRQGQWLLGRAWNNEKWGGELPNKSQLDKDFPDTPVILERIDGHMAWCNSKALELASISSSSKDPEGGEILRDSQGIPTGLLIDNAMDIVKDIIPKPSKEELKTSILTAVEELYKAGLDQVDDMDVRVEWLEAFKELAQENKLKIKIRSYIRGFDRQWEEQNILPEKINNFEIKGLKFYSDGALGSKGAALFEDYSDDPGNKGLTLISNSTINEVAQKAIPKGFEISVHAIGDKANRDVLDLFEKLRKEHPQAELRIEHAQIVHPDDWKRFKELDVKAYIQPMFEISDAGMAPKRLGERMSYAYPWTQLKASGTELIGSSDFPIEPHDPITGLNALLDHGFSAKDAIEIYSL